MAITKIWKVASSLSTSVNYIINPEKTGCSLNAEAVGDVEQYILDSKKTENAVYVRSYNCGTEKASKRMLDTQAKFGKDKSKCGVLAYHLVQSFKDFETTPEIAHKCGLELAERLFADKYEVIVATHLDQDHLHNHILFNAVSFVDGKKYRNNFKDYFRDIRGISDSICREYCLSVIDTPKHRGMHYGEWKAEQEGKSIRQQVREELDSVIKSSYTMNEFWKILEDRGYKITRIGVQYKYTSFIPPFGAKRIRLDKLGKYYTEDAIKERVIANRNGIKLASPSELTKLGFDFGKTYSTANPKRLKGFIALYYHYLYLFGMIKKKQVPQRVSFFMRDELIKFDRYKKQFEFLYQNGIATGAQLMEYQKDKDNEINALIEKRKKLYASITAENGGVIKAEAKVINDELRKLRKDVKLCSAISRDSYKISHKKQYAQELINQAEKEMKENEHKRGSR